MVVKEMLKIFKISLLLQIQTSTVSSLLEMMDEGPSLRIGSHLPALNPVFLTQQC